MSGFMGRSENAESVLHRNGIHVCESQKHGLRTQANVQREVFWVHYYKISFMRSKKDDASSLMKTRFRKIRIGD